ncbi:MAG: sensor histidine kinase, partial [Halobacteria archaeon]|nr:sensor histidine kinase [Halobacteria archaeon]
MDPEQGHKVAQELRYFGKVTASISHELKNVLAILNEHTGLLQDLTAMAE